MVAIAAAGAHGWCASRPPASVSAVPQSGLPPSSSLSAEPAITTAPATLASPMVAPSDRSMPAMMMTKVWPMATASSGQTLESWLEMLRGSARAGKNTATAAK